MANCPGHTEETVNEAIALIKNCGPFVIKHRPIFSATIVDFILGISFSIITPVLNNKDGLIKTINSIKKQKFK